MENHQKDCHQHPATRLVGDLQPGGRLAGQAIQLLSCTRQGFLFLVKTKVTGRSSANAVSYGQTLDIRLSIDFGR
ncbi:hypothetical protein [Aquitalea sp.]|uniref:hypothetical protein n=1 Tax=Aquitalea sp. TaxID=1872623 RepID=UPI0025836FC0|nr:hypothetical protein [Aquitalea sp.]